MNSDSTTSTYEGEKSVIKPKRFVVSRFVSEQALILDTSQDEIRQLNEVGSFIWSLVLKSKHTHDDMLAAIIDHFDVTREIARSDLNLFLEELSSADLIEYTD